MGSDDASRSPYSSLSYAHFLDLLLIERFLKKLSVHSLNKHPTIREIKSCYC